MKVANLGVSLFSIALSILTMGHASAFISQDLIEATPKRSEIKGEKADVLKAAIIQELTISPFYRCDGLSEGEAYTLRSHEAENMSLVAIRILEHKDGSIIVDIDPSSQQTIIKYDRRVTEWKSKDRGYKSIHVIASADWKRVKELRYMTSIESYLGERNTGSLLTPKYEPSYSSRRVTDQVNCY